MKKDDEYNVLTNAIKDSPPDENDLEKRIIEPVTNQNKGSKVINLKQSYFGFHFSCK